MSVDQKKLEAFVGKAVGDLGTALTAALIVIGDKLGLFKALAAAGALTPPELAQRTGTSERYAQPHRPRVLLRLDADLHARLAVAGGRHGSWGASE